MDEATIDQSLLRQIRTEHTDRKPLYINFTSGSTGLPKGVAVSHRAVMDFIRIYADTFAITKEDIIGNQAPFDFDVSVKDIYTGLLTGAKVQIIPREYFSDPTTLMDYMADSKMTVLTWAVSAMCFVSVMNGFGYRTPDADGDGSRSCGGAGRWPCSGRRHTRTVDGTGRDVPPHGGATKRIL